MLIRASQINRNGETCYDLCIVGSGAAGMALASQFWDEKRSICMIESGTRSPKSRYQSLNHAECVGLPYDTVESRCRALGGTLNVWGGRCAPLDLIDFQPRPWIPHSGWPIDFDQLRPYYVQATEFLGSREGIASFDEITDTYERSIEKICIPNHEFDRKPFLLLGSYAFSHAKQLRRKVIESENVDCIIEGTVVEIIQDENGKITQVILKLLGSDETLKVCAKAFVICAGGLETPRLLLASQRKSTKGIGNSNDIVGRFFMDHPRIRSTIFSLPHAVRVPILTQAAVGFKGLQIAFTVKNELQEKLEIGNCSFFLNPMSIDVEDRVLKSLQAIHQSTSVTGGLPKGFSEARLALVRRLRSCWRQTPGHLRFCIEHIASLSKFKHLTVVTKIEQFPNPASRITLAKDKDEFSMPKIRLDWRIDKGERDRIARFHNMIKSTFQREGHRTETLSFLGPDDDYIYQDSSHPMGTTRMSDDPRTGVVDRDLKVFDIPNLFICSSSVFPTAGNANPTLTIIALAKRLGDHLENQFALGRF